MGWGKLCWYFPAAKLLVVVYVSAELCHSADRSRDGCAVLFNVFGSSYYQFLFSLFVSLKGKGGLFLVRLCSGSRRANCNVIVYCQTQNGHHVLFAVFMFLISFEILCVLVFICSAIQL